MAFSKVKTDSIADSGVTTAKIANDAVVASKVDDDGTGFTVGNLTSTSTVTLGSGGTNWTLPTARGTDKYVLQINGTTGASNWAESLTAPELSSHSYDVSGTTDDGGINAYEAPFAYTGTTTNASTTISVLSSTTGLKAGQYISGAGIPANTTISSVNSGASTLVMSNQATAAASGVALKIQKTPGEKNGGKVTLTGTNFGTNVADVSVAITTSGGGVIANASYLTGLTSTSITAEWTGTEGSYSTDLTSSYVGKIYFKMTKSGLASNILDTNTNLTSDATLTELSTSSQTGGDRSATPSATSLGTYGTGRIAGGGQDSNTKVLLNFDRGGGTDIEDSSNIGDNGYKVTATNQASIKSSPFGDGKTAMYFDGSDDKLSMSGHADFQFQTANFTVEQWVYFDTVGADQGIWGHAGAGTNADPELSFYFEESTDKISLRKHNDTDSGNSKNFQCSWSPESKRWYHLALVRNSNQLYIYVDGKALPQVTTSSAVPFENGDVSVANTLPNMSTSQNFLIGCDHSDGRHFEGFMDSFRIVKAVAVYGGDFDVPTSRLTAITGTKLLIHSNVSFDEKADKHPTKTANAFETVAGTSGQAQGHSFSARVLGVNTSSAVGYYEYHLGNIGIGASDNWMVDFWIKTSYTGGADNWIWQIASPSGLGTADQFGFREDGGGGHDVRWNNAYAINDTQAVGNDTWEHWAITRDGSNMRTYLNGVLKGTNGSVSDDPSWDINDFTLRLGSVSSITTNTYFSEFRIVVGESIWTHTSGTGTLMTSSYDTTSTDSNAMTLLPATASNIKFLYTGSPRIKDSNSSPKTVTVTGAYHSQFHGGIATAIPWPASGKKFGASGVYFDGATDYLELGTASPLGTGKFTIDFWVNFKGSDSTGNYVPIMGNQQGTGTSSVGYFNINLKKVGSAHNFYVYEDGTGNDSSYAVDDGLWHHCMVTRNSDSYLELWVDGTRRYVSSSTATTNYDSAELWRIGHDDNQSHYYKGYLDNIRIVVGEDMTSVSTDPVYSANGTTYTVPTKIYGAYGVDTPNAGTITLTATGDGDYTWSEVSGGTALPGSLAVGSTTHSGSGNSRTHTATITGAFTSVSSDTTTSGILLKAQNDADATKAITLGTAGGGYDGISITQKSAGKSVLFNGRRYHGTATTKSISGYGFAPDLVWAKSRTSAWHQMHDTVRGTSGTGGGAIYVNANDASDTDYAIQSFDSDGFTLHDSRSDSINSNNGLIAWGWKAGGAPSSSALSLSGGVGAGTIANTGNVTAITQSVNQNSGFSITKYTGGAGATNATSAIPHNLGGTPDFIIIKNLSGAYDWVAYHKDLTTDKNVNLNNDTAEATKVRGFIDAPDGTNINLHASTDSTYYGRAVNRSGDNFICYAWKAVSGVSAFGTYEGVGNNNAMNSTASSLGFRPRFLMIKNMDGSGSWIIMDVFRNGTSTTAWYKNLVADGNNAEDTNANAYTVTINATGFQFNAGTPGVATGNLNTSGSTYIYTAFA